MSNLVILAAGLGSRFGGNKQLAEFGHQQLTLMEYNLLNAVAAGFTRVIFIIRPELESQLKRQVIVRLPKQLSYSIAFQTLKDLPKGCSLPSQRSKPLGTAHALWCCRHLLNDSFAVINADDFYGKQAFSLLLQQAKFTPEHYLMVAYQLKNTLSEFGGVNRGLCQLDSQHHLTHIEECEQITTNDEGITGILSTTQTTINLSENQLISMNCWFFTPAIFSILEQSITTLLRATKQAPTTQESVNLTAECYLPNVVMAQIQQQAVVVKVLSTTDSWFGLTYSQDSEQVAEKITALFTKK